MWTTQCLLSWKVAVGARLEEKPSGGPFLRWADLVNNWGPEDDCYPLFVRDGAVAAVAHAHLELEAHLGDGGAFGGTFATHGLPTLPAVVLGDTGLHGRSRKAVPRLRAGAHLPPGRFYRFQNTERYLSQSDLLAVPHLLEIPEERLLTLLAGVTVQPFWGLQNAFF